MGDDLWASEIGVSDLEFGEEDGGDTWRMGRPACDLSNLNLEVLGLVRVGKGFVSGAVGVFDVDVDAFAFPSALRGGMVWM